jgi:signal transduction histidine kinase
MRRFGEDAIAVLEEYPWPGNTRELETVVVQTLASGSSDPIRADDLQYDGTAFAPLDAGEFGQLLADTEREPPPAGPREQAPSAAPEPEPVPERDDGNSEPEGESGTGAESAAREGGETRRASPRIQPLLGAIAHEMRNPLSTIRTFAELLPDRYDDAEFRTRFSELVTHDTRRLESVLQRLSELATLARPNPTLVDVATMVSELLVEQRARLRERKLVVLQQLEPGGVSARADVAQLRGALDALLGKTMQLAPEGGDVTVAVRHGERDGAPAPGAQIELCFGGEPGGRPGFAGVSAAENSLEFVVAEAIVRLQGGTFRLESGKAGETVVIVDLPG